jgi:predicted permease
MIIIIEQMALLFSFMCLGFFFGKRKIVNTEHTKLISALCVNLFMPCTVFKAFYTNFNRTYLVRYSQFIFVSACILIVLVVAGFFIANKITDDKYQRNVYRYSFIVSNYGYMGYALAEGIYGQTGLLNIVIFAMPIAFYIYTFGYCMLTKRGFSLIKLINPVIVAMAFGAIVGFFEIKLPEIFISITGKASVCMAPMSMLMAGMAMSEYRVKELVTDKKAYYMAFFRLIFIPLCVYLVLKPLCPPDLTRTAVLLFCMPYGLNPIIFAKLVDENYFFPAKLCFISSIFSIVTVPAFLSLI